MPNDLYEDVTRNIIAEMEAGILPWEKPWGEEGTVEPARNAVTGRHYSGVNTLLLWQAVSEKSFSCNRWVTFNQANRFAGGVRRGARSTRIYFAKPYVPREERDRVAAGTVPADAAETRFHLRFYAVFNLDQTRKPPARLMQPSGERGLDGRLQAVQDLAERNKAVIQNHGEDAYYNHAGDFIVMPPLTRFRRSDDYCATLLHELTHWTGHAERLHRKFGGEISGESYVMEELVAELGAAYLSANFGIQPRARHSDYIGYWLASLRDDSRALFRAARLASQASDYLLGETTAALLAAGDSVAEARSAKPPKTAERPVRQARPRSRPAPAPA